MVELVTLVLVQVSHVTLLRVDVHLYVFLERREVLSPRSAASSTPRIAGAALAGPRVDSFRSITELVINDLGASRLAELAGAEFFVRQCCHF